MKSLSVVAAICILLAEAPSLLSAPQSGPASTAGPGATSASPTNANSGPRIQFNSTTYNFGKVLAGPPVKCEFIFTNTGDATLEITAVSPGCHCTTPGNWSRKVEAGRTGVIPLELQTAYFGGQSVTRTVTVISNAKNQPTSYLQLTGTVWKAIDVNPQAAVLNVLADSTSNATAVVRIVSGLDEPVTLSEPECNNQAFAASLKTIRPGKEFELLIQTATPLNQGTAQGVITMKTSVTNVPTISVTAYAIVKPSVVIVPPQIFLPAGPITNAIPSAVSIQNNSSNPLTLSDPSISTNGVDIQMREVIPGKQFTVSLTFPAGFEIPPGRILELSVKTSNPRNPVIKVPVRQLPRAVRPLAIPPPPPVGAPATPPARS